MDKNYTLMDFDKTLGQLRLDISDFLLDYKEINNIRIKDISENTGITRNTITNVLNCKNDYELESAYHIGYAMMDITINNAIKPRLSIMIELYEKCSEQEQYIFEMYVNKKRD